MFPKIFQVSWSLCICRDEALDPEKGKERKMELLISWSAFLLLLLVFPIISLLLLRQSSRDGRGRTLLLPPSPPKLPIIGNLHQLVGAALPHRALKELSAKHGPHLMLLQLGEKKTLVVSSAEMAREVCETQDRVFASRPKLAISEFFFRETMDIALAPYGENWRRARKVCVVHLLSPKLVKSFRPAREEETGRVMEQLHEMITESSVTAAGAVAVNMSELLHAFASDVSCRVMSGSFYRKEERNVALRRLVDANSAILGEVHIEDAFPSMSRWLDIFTRLRCRVDRLRQKWDAVLDVMLNESREGDVSDFIGVLLSVQEEYGLNRDDIKSILIDTLAGGIDTTFVTLDWSLALLMQNPAEMKRLQDEVRVICAGKSSVGEEDLEKLGYLKCVVKETLRLHPPLPLLIQHETMEDCEIAGYAVPKNTAVFINAWAIGRDPREWEDAEEFRPERFVDSDVDFKGRDFQFIPFGAGRRMCPGMGFGLSTVQLMLANLLFLFDWELPSGMSKESIDMTEAAGISTRRKEKLLFLNQ